MTSQFFEANYSLQQRLDVLFVLEESSIELAEGTATDMTSSTMEEQQSVMRQIGTVTKKWGTATRPKKQLTPKSNHFILYASCFFYPLTRLCDSSYVKRYVSHSVKFTLCRAIWTTEPIIVSQVLHLFGVIIQCLGTTYNMAIYHGLGAGGTTESISMCRTCLDILWSYRFHDQSAVRRAVLFTLCQVMVTCLPAFILLSQDFLDVNNEVQQWLHGEILGILILQLHTTVILMRSAERWLLSFKQK